MELSGPAIDQLAAQSGDSAQFQQAIASLLPGISESLMISAPPLSGAGSPPLLSEPCWLFTTVAVYTCTAIPDCLALSGV